MARWLAAFLLTTTLAYADKKPQPTVEELRDAVAQHWSAVRDITVVDRASLIEYRNIPVLALPKGAKSNITPRPNVWRAAPGLEYLELWQGDKCVTVAFDGFVTRWQGRRTAFGPLLGRIREGHNVPFDDIGFAYYVGRLGRHAALPDFLSLPTTRITKPNVRIDDLPCIRVEGPCPMTLEGVEKTYDVRMELAPQYGWLPIRARFSDPATGFPVREYRVRSFFNVDKFPFPKEAQVNLYEIGQSDSPNSRPHARLQTSLVYYVESVAINQGLGPADFAFQFDPEAQITDERAAQPIP